MKNAFIFLFSAVLGTLFVIYFGQNAAANILSPTSEDSLTPEFSAEKPPSESLIGKVISITGDVAWQSRVATESAKLTEHISIQQGEMLETRDGGKMAVEFPGTASINLLPKTKIDVAQTLPVNMVLVQQEGTAIYKKLGAVPISVRSHGMLVQIESGEAMVSLNSDQTIVTVTPASGAIKAAFVNDQNETQIINISYGTKVAFDTEKKQANVL